MGSLDWSESWWPFADAWWSTRSYALRSAGCVLGRITGKSLCQIVWRICILEIRNCRTRTSRFDRCCCTERSAVSTTVRRCSPTFDTSISDYWNRMFIFHTALSLYLSWTFRCHQLIDDFHCFIFSIGKRNETSSIRSVIRSSILCDRLSQGANNAISFGFTKWHECTTRYEFSETTKSMGRQWIWRCLGWKLVQFYN